jgi:uncharacterized membrane protein
VPGAKQELDALVARFRKLPAPVRVVYARLLVYAMVLRSGLAHIRRNAMPQDDGRFLILLVTALGAFASIAAIVFELGASRRV